MVPSGMGDEQAASAASRTGVGPLVISIPAGWSYQHQVTIQLPPPARGAVSPFQPNIVVIKQPLEHPGFTVEALADVRRPLLAQHLPQFEFDLTSRIELLGRPALRMMYTWHDGTSRIRQMLVLCIVDDAVYELTYTDVSTRFGDSVVEFDRWLTTLGLAGATVSEPAAGSTPP